MRTERFEAVLRTEIRRYWNEQAFFRTSEFQTEMAEALVPDGESLNSTFLMATWVYYTEMRDAFLRVIPEFCPHRVRINVARFPPLAQVQEWMAENGAGKLGYVSAHIGFMHYYFSDPDDAFAFKLTFC